jgi:hypothetical protein
MLQSSIFILLLYIAKGDGLMPKDSTQLAEKIEQETPYSDLEITSKNKKFGEKKNVSDGRYIFWGQNTMSNPPA